MHETLEPQVKGFIDQQSNGKLVGWAFHEIHGSLPLRIQYSNKTENKIVLPVTRDDVVLFFIGKHNISCCGFNETIEERHSFHVEMQIEGSWTPIFHIKAFAIRPIQTPSFVVVDNFYEDPDAVREFALQQSFQEHIRQHKGKRTDTVFRFPGLKEAFEKVLQTRISSWDTYGTNGCFQYCIGGDQLVYHYDCQEYAGVLFLTPDAPPQSGTAFYRSKHTKKMTVSRDEQDIVFRNGFLDPTEFDVVDVVGNVYNRLVLFNAKMIHSATSYFGTNQDNSRLFQLFFFDIEKK